MKPLFKIVFEDGETYLGGNYQQMKWLSIPDKAIQELEVLLPNGKYLPFEDYLSYYLSVEVTTDLNGKDAGIKKFAYMYVMVKDYSTTLIRKINLKTGEIESKIMNNDSEFFKKFNPAIWKKGGH